MRHAPLRPPTTRARPRSSGNGAAHFDQPAPVSSRESSPGSVVQRRMRLPSLSREALPRGRAALFDALARTNAEQGFIHATAGGSEGFLFFRDGRVWCAGTREGGSPGASTVSAFVRTADAFDEAVLCRTDLPLFLCAAVMFRKPPSAHIPAALVDGEGLLKSLRSLGKDAVLAVQKKDAWALAFCRSGEPVALYAAPELGLASEGTPTDRLMELVYGARDEVTLDLYDEIRLPPAADAGQPIVALAAPLPAEGTRASVVVLLGDRVVFRQRIEKAETIVGRGLEADLALDNLSVSRRHAVLRVSGEVLVVEDLGSENGLSLAGTRVERAVLKPGERVGIGKYTITWTTAAAGDAAPAPRRISASADIQTVSLSGRTAVVEHNGQRHKVSSAVFTIGSGADAHLRIRGLFVAPVHAVLHAAGDGYRVEHAGGVRKLTINGDVTRQAALRDGDEIVIAGEKMLFRLG